MFSGSAELKDGRSQMDAALERLRRVTEFAILANSEHMLDEQAATQDMIDDLRQELRRNDAVQERLASSQLAMVQELSDDFHKFQDEYKADIKKLLAYQEAAAGKKGSQSPENVAKDTVVQNRFRSFYTEPPPDVSPRLLEFESSKVDGTNEWLFNSAIWHSWLNDSSASPILSIQGYPGVGKSFLAASIYQKLKQASEIESTTVYFAYSAIDLKFRWMHFAYKSFVIQMTDQSSSLRDFLEPQLSDVESTEPWFEYSNGTRDRFLCDTFTRDSKFKLYIILDDVDEMDGEYNLMQLHELIFNINERQLRIKMVLTSRLTDLWNAHLVLRIGRDEISQDLRHIVWDRFHNKDNMFSSLRRLQTRSKQRVARCIQQKADSAYLHRH